ncbi:putative cytochrome P450, partial [Aureobasidium melanogenum]
MSPFILYGFWLLLLFVAWTVRNLGRRPQEYPPGPPTLPLIGNLHLMPKKNGHLQFQKWAQEYGPVYSLVLGTKVFVVLSSDQAIKDLLDKRSAIYSSRPEVYMGQEILSGGLRVLFMGYNDTWRMIRKLAHSILNVTVARSQIFECFSEMTGSSTAALLDVFPVLRRLPDILLPIRQYGRQIHERERELFMHHYTTVKQKIKDRTAHPCASRDLVNLQAQQGFSDELAAYMAGSLLQAGSETTAAILVGFVQAIVIFPEIASTAQVELDRVCGDRIPDLNDLSRLPYIRGCIKESLRWMPTDVLGVPHSVIRDDEYMGYRIPKGATVIFNVWAVQNDPLRHPNPRVFDPTRWINDDQNSAESATNPDATRRDHFVFGAGRRICQGMHIADRSLFLGISRLLWAFDFRRAVDQTTKKEIVPDMDNVSQGLFICPNPFPANIVPRSAQKASQVRDEWAKISKLLDQNGQWAEVPEALIWKDYE